MAIQHSHNCYNLEAKKSNWFVDLVFRGNKGVYTFFKRISPEVRMLYSHIINMLIYTYTCSCCIHTDAINNDERILL